MKKYLIAIFCLLTLPTAIWAADANQAENLDPQTDRLSIRIVNPLNGNLEKEIFPWPEDSKNLDQSIDVADVNNDNFSEIIVAAGRQEKPLVKIFSNKGEFLSEFLAYDEKYNQGLRVIVADLYNSENKQIIVSPLEGGSCQVRIFTPQGKVMSDFFAFDKDITGGCSITVGDVNNDNQKEILVGAGYGMKSIVKIFDNYTNFIKAIEVFDNKYDSGINVLAADIDNDRIAEILVAPNTNYAPEIRIFDYNGNMLKTFFAYHPGFGGGVNLASADIDDDGFKEIITGPGFSGGSHIRYFDLFGVNKLNPKFFVYNNFYGGLSIAADDLDNDNQIEIIAAKQTISLQNKYNAYKQIEIDLTKQRLYTFFKGAPEKDFIISSGKWKFPTPEGNFKVLTKVPKTRMARYYGPDNPNNYDLPNVPSVMYFYRDYAIHGAYWHWRFGQRVSHGCVNLKIPDAKWLYDWSKTGTPVKIYSSKK